MKALFKFYAKVFGKSYFIKLNYYLFRLSLNGLGILNYYNYKLSGEKYFISKILPKYLPKRSVLFDVGANVGNYSSELIKQFPDASLHVFEPHPKTFEILSKKVFLNSTSLNNLALSSEEGKIQLFDYAERDGSSHASVVRGVIENIHSGDSMVHEVNKKTLDDYIKINNIDNIDLLKIDVEGHELEVLKGAKNILKESKVKIVQLEFNEMNVESRTYLMDFRKELKGFNFYRLLTTGLLPLKKYVALTNEIFAFQNIIAIHRSIDNEG